MNKMKEVAALLGVELGEVFRLKEEDQQVFKLTSEGLHFKGYADEDEAWDLDYPELIVDLILGDLVIEKIPPREFQIGDIVSFDYGDVNVRAIIVAFDNSGDACVLVLDRGFQGHVLIGHGVTINDENNRGLWKSLSTLKLIKEVQDLRPVVSK